VRALPRWDAAASGTNETVLFTERISRVRLLGCARGRAGLAEQRRQNERGS
jgi:hypothetical protein